MQVQKWAVEHVRMLGTVTREEYDEGIDEALYWVFSVAQHGLLARKGALPSTLAPRNHSRVWAQSAQTVLPSHLYSSAHPKAYWLGMCMLLKALDRKLLRSEEFWQKAAKRGCCTLPDAVVRTMQLSHCDASRQDCDRDSTSEDEDTQDPVLLHTAHLSAPSATQTAFWPALQCFITLVDRLGTCFWKYISHTPVQVIQMIVSNPHYCREVANWLDCEAAGSTSLTEDFPVPSLTPLQSMSECVSEDSITCSQMVYDWKSSTPDSQRGSRRSRKKKTRGHYEMLQWCEPFVRSLVEGCSQQVLFEAISLLVSHLRGLYDSIVRVSPGESSFQLSSHSALAAQSLAQLLKVVAVLLQSKHFQLAKAIMRIKQEVASQTGATNSNTENSSLLSLAAEVVTEAAASIPADGSQFAVPSFLPRQQTPFASSVLPECVPAACPLVRTLLGRLHNGRSIAYAVNSLCAKCVLPTSSSVRLLSVCGAGFPLAALTPRHTLGVCPLVCTGPMAMPSNPFAKESHHLQQISALGRDGLVAMLEKSLEGKATQDTHEE